MLLKYFYDTSLSHASYLVGCQKTGEAIVVDPGRDIQPYLDAARDQGMRIVGAAETHIHADYVSGARELADRVGAKLYLSDEGPPEWKYTFADEYPHQLLKDGDRFHVGRVEFQVLHTPGHTPESISFLLTDTGGGADQPMGIFTGDFVFVGSIGRPDLLEEAAGLAGTAEPGARDLFHSLQRFRKLPDYLQVWPAHGAGSACGKGLGAIPSTTVGYEKQFNPAFKFQSEEAFVRYILADQPEAPKYFAVMKRVNKEGPPILGDAPLPKKLPVEQLATIAHSQTVVDTAKTEKYLQGHVPGTINIEPRMMAHWGGSLLDYDRPIYLITTPAALPELTRVMRKIGIESFGGYFDADEVERAGRNTSQITQATPQQLAARIQSGEVELIDVRGQAERASRSIPGSHHYYLGRLPEDCQQLADDRTYAFHCRSGHRSVIASSIAERCGLRSVINLTGGIDAWEKAGLPVEHSATETATAQ